MKTTGLKRTVRAGVMGASLALVAMAALVATPASAQSIEDKLRTQLRTTAQQLRELQDTQAQEQADKATAEQQRDKALADLKQAQADLAAAHGEAGAQAVAQRALAAEKAGRAQDAAQLAKDKSAYEALLALSKSREAETARVQAAQKAAEAQVGTCEAKNVRLYEVGHTVLDAYEHLSVADFMKSREPFAQSTRVKYDQIAQDYGDQLYANRYDPNALAQPAAASAAATTGASASSPASK